MINPGDKLSTVEFHAYVDSQLTDLQYEDIERRLGESPDIIIDLQNCLLINERIQSCFQGPDVEIEEEVSELENESQSLSSDSLEFILPEPALSTASELGLEDSDLSMQESYADLESLELHEPAPEATFDTILPPRNTEPTPPEILSPEIAPPELTLSESTEPEIAMQNITVKKVTRHSSTAPVATAAVPPVLTDSAYNAPQPEAAPSDDDIDVDNFLRGINETHMVDNSIPAMTQASLSQDIFSPSAPFSTSPSLFARLKANIIGLFSRFSTPKAPLSKQALAIESAQEESFDEFEIGIDEAMQSTPKLRFWRFRMQHAADDALDSVKEQLEPISPTVSPWLSKLHYVFSSINAGLRKIGFIDKTMDQSYWILGGLVIGLILGAWLFSAGTVLNKNNLESMAIDSHLYFVDQGANVAEGGIDDFEKNMKWLQSRWGKRVINYDVSENSKFRKKGTTLLPTLNDYASVQIFENFNGERITLYVSRSPNKAKNSRVRCHIADKVDGICNWTRDSLIYFVVGNLSLSRVRHFSSLIASQS